MKVRGIIFDFGFTLFSFENPSVAKYMDCFRRGMSKSIKVLKQEKIIEDNDQILEDFHGIPDQDYTQNLRLSIICC